MNAPSAAPAPSRNWPARSASAPAAAVAATAHRDQPVFPARPHVRQLAIAHCETVRDYISREILEDILESEEEHIDFLEIQLDLISSEGLQNWLQSQAH